MKCKYCCQEIDEGSVFCGYCGKKQPEVKYCIKCGQEIGLEDLYCGYCGTSQVIDKTEVAVTDEQQKEQQLQSTSQANEKKIEEISALETKGVSDIVEETPNEEVSAEDRVDDTSVPAVQVATDTMKNKPHGKKYLIIACGVVIAIILGGGYLWSKTQRSNTLLTMESVIDLYSNMNKEYVVQVLKENGYSLFTTEDDNTEHIEYWTKDVQLKKVTTDSHWIDKGYYYEPTEKKGGCVEIHDYKYLESNFHITIIVYADKDFRKWEEQLKEMEYTEEELVGMSQTDDGWTAQGNHGNYFKKYKDSKGNCIEFADACDGIPGYAVYSVELSSKNDQWTSVKAGRNVFTVVYATSDDGFVNIREQPSSNARVVGEILSPMEGLGNGVSCWETAKNGEWTKVSTRQCTGWAYSKYLGYMDWYEEKGESVLISAVDNMPIYLETYEDDTPMPIFAKLPKGTIVADDYYEGEEYYELRTVHDFLFVKKGDVEVIKVR